MSKPNEHFVNVMDVIGTVEKAPEGWRPAMVDVIGTAEFCRTWLNQHYSNSYTPSDLIAMTKLVIEQKNHYVWNDERITRYGNTG